MPSNGGFFGFGILPGSEPGEPAKPRVDLLRKDLEPQLGHVGIDIDKAREAFQDLNKALRTDNAREALAAADKLRRALNRASQQADEVHGLVQAHASQP